MSNTKKLIQAAAGAAGGAGLNVEEVFSTYLYEGNGTSQTITNDIDLSSEGGLVWVRPRTTSDHWLWDSARGTQYSLATNNTATQTDMSTNGTVFNTDGFTDRMGWGSGTDVASWTFRKAPKFFDVVTYTGTGSPQSISHNLESVPGCIIVKTYDNAQGWAVYHRGNTSAPETERLILEQTYATSDDNTYWNDTAPTSTHFTVGNTIRTNSNGYNYVAYLFAHNNGDGEFGSTADQDIIKCGSVTLDGSGQGLVDLGFEPSWIMYKRTDGAGNWIVTDSMRGWTALPNQAGASLLANSNVAEGAYSPASYLNSSGFLISGSSGQTYVYIAIRRGPMAVPTAATDVFHVNEFTTTGFTEYTGVGFAPDLAVQKAVSSADNWEVVDKLRGPHVALRFNETSAESAADTQYLLGGFLNDGVKMGTATNGQFNGWNPNLHYYWQRRPNYFDVVAYAGAGAAQTINHNLGVAPEMIWVKVRDFATSWTVFHKDLGIDKWLNLDNTNTVQTASGLWGTSDPDATTFGLGLNTGLNNGSGRNYIAYLFASLDGVSKVGSYAGNGSSQNIDCGFSSGARFVLIKSIQSGSWYVFDSQRGIVAGNDGHLLLNNTDAEAYADSIDPYSSGFTVVQNATTDLNKGPNDETYIFYAIA